MTHDIPSRSRSERAVPEDMCTKEEAVVTMVLREEFRAVDAPVQMRIERGRKAYLQELPLGDTEQGDRRSLVIDYGMWPKENDRGPQEARIVTHGDTEISEDFLLLSPGRARDGLLYRPKTGSAAIRHGDSHPYYDQWHYANARDFELFAKALVEFESQTQNEPVDQPLTSKEAAD